MRSIKALIGAAVTVLALAAAMPAAAADPPFPMNPYPAAEVEYVFQLQTLFGHGSKIRPTQYCADSSVFKRGHQIVFRMIITDAKTGKVMTGKDMSRVLLRITGQPDVKMPFRPQGGKPDATSPWMWSTAWVVPADYPLGTFKFDFLATVKKTKKQVKWDPVIPGTDWSIIP